MYNICVPVFVSVCLCDTPKYCIPVSNVRVSVYPLISTHSVELCFRCRRLTVLSCSRLWSLIHWNSYSNLLLILKLDNFYQLVLRVFMYSGYNPYYICELLIFSFSLWILLSSQGLKIQFWKLWIKFRSSAFGQKWIANKCN